MGNFTPTKSQYPRTFVGFWKPKEGDVVKGRIDDAWDGDFGITLLVHLTDKLTVEKLDKDTGVKVDFPAKGGDHIGVNMKAGLRGLDKYVGHDVTIRCLGKEKLDGGLTEWQFDTDVSPKIVPAREAKPAPKSKSAGGLS